MDNFYLQSTFFPAFNQGDDKSTIQKISSVTLPGENTDATIGPSIFDLPQEHLEKMQSADKTVAGEKIKEKQS